MAQLDCEWFLGKHNERDSKVQTGVKHPLSSIFDSSTSFLSIRVILPEIYIVSLRKNNLRGMVNCSLTSILLSFHCAFLIFTGARKINSTFSRFSYS